MAMAHGVETEPSEKEVSSDTFLFVETQSTSALLMICLSSQSVTFSKFPPEGRETNLHFRPSAAYLDAQIEVGMWITCGTRQGRLKVEQGPVRFDLPAQKNRLLFLVSVEIWWKGARFRGS